MNTTKIIFQAYGEKYINQTIYSITSLINSYKKKFPTSVFVIVYTDDTRPFIHFFSSFPVQAIHVDKDLLTQWKGSANFVFRTKIKCLQQEAKSFDGNLLYLDSDTYVVRNLTPLIKEMDKDNCILHLKEWPLHHGRGEWHPTLYEKEISLQMQSGLHITISDSSTMWNSGVIGIPYSKHALIGDILQLNDELYEKNPHFLTEQLSFSIILSTNTVLAASDFIIHYWNDKNRIDIYLAKLLESPILLDPMRLLLIVGDDDLFKKPASKLIVEKLKFFKRKLLFQV